MLRYIKYSLISFLEYLGFVHRHRWYLNGDDARLLFRDPSVDKRGKDHFAGVLFNTRSGSIDIGRNVMMGHNVMILAGKHKDVFENPLTVKPNIESGYDIKISCGVWLTSGVVVTGGVTIGENTTVLPLSVVSESLPSNCIAAGNPARFISNKVYEE
tara:strand:- start:98 stop:568 length:471 start_codon:yes stop_codon:yes gene_type:complete